MSVIGRITYQARRPYLVMEPETITCPSCEGLGWKAYDAIERDNSIWAVSYDCPHCKGSGRLWRDGTAAPRGMSKPPNS